MQFTKLVKVLKALNAQQLKRLKKYIHSPYFGINSAPIALFNFLEPLHPQFELNTITAKKLAAFSANLHTLKQQETAGVRLLDAVENFMAVEHWRQNKSEVTRHTLAAFKQTELSDEFDKGFKKQMQQLNQCPEQNFDTFFERHALTELSLNGFDARLKRTAQNNIKPVIKTLNVFYAAKKIRYLCEDLNRYKVLGANHDEEDLVHILAILEPYTNSKSPYIYLFVNVYRMMAESTYAESNIYYMLLKQFIETQTQTAPPQSIREIADYALNCCLRWYNKGYSESGNEYIWWIEWKRKNNLLFQNEKLMPITFRNIISIAVINKINPAVIVSLIQTYAPHLPDEHHETYLSFANGLYQYSLKNHKKAIRLFLSILAKEDAVFNCTVRRWLWICSYECDPGGTDTLLNQYQSFEKYLQRNKKELQHIAGTLELFMIYIMLLLKSPGRQTLDTHLNSLQHEAYFPGKRWLLEQFSSKNKKPVRVSHGSEK